MTKTKEMNEKIDNLLGVKFTVSNCPKQVFDDFIRFCRAETKNDWSTGIKLLLERNAVNAKDSFFIEVMQDLKEKVEELELKYEPEKKEKKMPKTLGGGEK